jgi:hypothetical protein
MKNIISILFASALCLSLAACPSATLTVIDQGTITVASGNGIGLNQTVDLVYSSLPEVTILNFSNSPDNRADQVNWADQLVVVFSGNTLDQWRLPEAFESTINLSSRFGFEGDWNSPHLVYP